MLALKTVLDLGETYAVLPAHRLFNRGKFNFVSVRRAAEVIEHHGDRLGQIVERIHDKPAGRANSSLNHPLSSFPRKQESTDGAPVFTSFSPGRHQFSGARSPVSHQFSPETTSFTSFRGGLPVFIYSGLWEFTCSRLLVTC